MTELSDAAYLRARYGTPTRDKRTVWIVAAVAVLIGAIWLVVQLIAMGRPTASAEPIAMDVLSASEVQVTYNLTAPVGSTVTCTITAVDRSFTEVGVLDVTAGPTELEITAVTAVVATIREATGANIENCVILEQ